ncbi:MAG TPA: hypothetical protein VFQ79_19400 [Bryobacteraceae bacterium]|nr:hypothetical protein [Bryobacteraceae bacterium]
MSTGVFLFVVAEVIAPLSAGHPEETPSGEYTWKNVVYLGGVPGVRVDRGDFDQTLTVTPLKLIVIVQPPPDLDASKLPRKRPPRVLFEIPRDSIIGVNYEGFRHDMPIAQIWFGIPRYWPKATDHLLVLTYRLCDGRETEVLLRVDKNHFREILQALRN